MRPIISAYRVEEAPLVRVEWCGEDKWAIRNRGECLNRNGEWEYEPLPSSRTDEFLERCRFSLADALDALKLSLGLM